MIVLQQVRNRVLPLRGEMPKLLVGQKYRFRSEEHPYEVRSGMMAYDMTMSFHNSWMFQRHPRRQIHSAPFHMKL